MISFKLFVFAIILACLAISVFDFPNKSSNNNSFETVCVDGVEYLSWAVGHRGYFAPHYKPTSDLYLCDEASNE